MSTEKQPTTTVKVEHAEDEREGGPNKCGRKFVEYWMSPERGADQVTEIEKLGSKVPQVDVAFKIYRVSDFDPTAGTLFVSFVLMLDWEDKSLSIAGNPKSPDFHEHFWPKPELLGLTPDGVATGPDYDEVKPKFKREKMDQKEPKFGEFRSALTYKYDAKLYTRLDFRDFPFDSQALELQIKLLSVRLPGAKNGTRPQVCHPTRWRSTENKGHQMLSTADNLPEFAFVRLVGRGYSSAYGAFPKKFTPGSSLHDKFNDELAENNNQLAYRDQYSLQIIMVREPEAILFNMLFALVVVDVMVASAHGIPIPDLADRLSVNLTLLLTAMAFKFVLADKLPPTPYLTTLEKYVLCTFTMLFVQGIAFWFLADMYNYRCGSFDEPTSTDWWTGEVKPVNSTVFFKTSCETLHFLDRIVLSLEGIMFFVKNFWFMNRIVQNNVKHISKQSHFVDLTNFEEFKMPEPLSWIKPDPKTRDSLLDRRGLVKKSTYVVSSEEKE
jgi:hypothetical protein